MKIRNPRSRHDIRVKKNDKVLEVGGGHNPHPRANVILDKFPEDNTHRCGDIKVLQHQQFIEGDGEHLPFEDKSFDYVICNHVLEHVDNPEAFLKEQFRVAKGGYLETPSLIGELLFQKKSHKWVVLEIDHKLVLVEKEKIRFPEKLDFAPLFQDYLPKNSIGYKILERTHPNIHTVRIEWKDSFEFVVNPEDPALMRYFEETWTEEMVAQNFPRRSLGFELLNASRAFLDICKSIFKSRFINNKRTSTILFSYVMLMS